MSIFLSNICMEYNYQMEFVKEGFEINKFRIDKDIYLMPGLNIFPYIGFKQMLETALSAKEFEWVEKFIEEHIHELKEEILSFKQQINHLKEEHDHSNEENIRLKQQNIRLN